MLGVHPLTLLTVAYMDRFTPKDIEQTTTTLRAQLLEVLSEN
ncbi:hypothetical protein [Paraburkholderia xenovorans]